MKTVTIREAKNRLTELAREVERGETIVVTRNGSPVFELTPHRPRKGLRLEAIEEFKRKRGIDAIVAFIADDFDDPLPEDFLAASSADRRMKLLLDTHVLLGSDRAGRGRPARGGRRIVEGWRQ